MDFLFYFIAFLDGTIGITLDTSKICSNIFTNLILNAIWQPRPMIPLCKGLHFSNFLYIMHYAFFKFIRRNFNSQHWIITLLMWKSTLLGVIWGIISFGVEIHAQNSGIHSQKSDSNHYFGVDSTIFESGFPLQNEVIPNMNPKRVDFHSATLREYDIIFKTVSRYTPNRSKASLREPSVHDIVTKWFEGKRDCVWMPL